MATALWIKREDLVRNTAIGGNVDTDKFIQFIKIAQEIHIQNYTGTKLYDKISNDIIANTLANPYLALVTTTFNRWSSIGRWLSICRLLLTR
jgi:hypothetical protein